MTLKLIMAFSCSFAVTLLIGLALVPALRKKTAGQAIREDGPVWHMAKQGTPTMGGIMFIGGIAAACLICGASALREGDWRHIIILVFSLVFAAIGFLDDYEKLRNRRNMGLTARQKFLLQLAAAVVLILFLRWKGHLSPNLYLPISGRTVHVNEIAYFVFAAFVIVGGVNAVNITDGIDGLAAGVSIPVAAAYAAIAAAWGYASVGIFGAAMAGGLAAFLIFNFHPAKIFMGDTGSLFLGGAVCASAFALDAPLILVFLGIVYVIETLSDIIQIVYFKATHGKRIFKMAPLHHHFEMCGWNEYKIFAVFTAVSAVFAVGTYFLVRGRFGA